MSYAVFITEHAIADLVELDGYLEENDPEKANYVLEKLEASIRSLEKLPNRGHYPPELSTLGNQEYREILWTSYRIIYRVLDDSVYIYVVADSRRDLQELLHRRLLNV